MTDDDRRRRGHQLLTVLAVTRFHVALHDLGEVHRLLRRWLDNWVGGGLIVAGMARQDPGAGAGVG